MFRPLARCLRYAARDLLAGGRGLPPRRPGARGPLGYARECTARAALEASPLFDAADYRRRAGAAGPDPVLHYLRVGAAAGLDPGPDFCNEDYLTANGDVRASGENPLAHYLLRGRREGRPLRPPPPPPPPPPGAVEGKWAFHPAAVHPPTRRVAVFAAVLPGGRLAPDREPYLRALAEIADDVVFVASGPILPEELEKLRGLARAVVCRTHGAYDFGSYRIGLVQARRLSLLAEARELVLANDSCLAPVTPLPDLFRRMDRRPCDFWGLTQFRFLGAWHLQSFFYAFRRPVLESTVLDGFLAGFRTPIDRGEAVVRGEARLTRVLAANGFRFRSLVPRRFQPLHRWDMPTRRPLALLRRYGMPLLKRKLAFETIREDWGAVVAEVRRRNPELAPFLNMDKPTCIC